MQGSEYLLSKTLEFHDKDFYVNPTYMEISEKEMTNNYMMSWTSSIIKKRYLQDNVLAINVKPYDIRTYFDGMLDKTTFDETLKANITSTQLAHISDNMNLSVVYNSTILRPKDRDGNMTYYYNDNEYDSNEYGQIQSKYPAHYSESMSMDVRSSELLDAMDVWNFEYSNMKKNNATHNTFDGHINSYANGYWYLLSTADYGQYGDDTLQLSDVKSLNDEDIMQNSITVQIDGKQTTDYMPTGDKAFRSFLYDVYWEYPLCAGDGSNQVHAYKYVSSFDYLSKWLFTYDDNYRQTYQNNDYAKKNTHLTKNKYILPYNMAFELSTRIAMNTDDGVVNVLMLRLPSVEFDTDICEITDDGELKGYDLTQRFFALDEDESIIKLDGD